MNESELQRLLRHPKDTAGEHCSDEGWEIVSKEDINQTQPVSSWHLDVSMKIGSLHYLRRFQSNSSHYHRSSKLKALGSAKSPARHQCQSSLLSLPAEIRLRIVSVPILWMAARETT